MRNYGQIVVIVISIFIIYFAFNSFTTNLVNTGVYKNFTGGSIITKPEGNLSSNAIVYYNYNFTQDYVLPILTNQDNQFLQFSLVIATTLIGLYAIMFLEIVKKINSKLDSYKNFKYVGYVFLIVAILPFPFLFASVTNIINALSINANMSGAIGAYQATHNISFNPTTPTVNVSVNGLPINLETMRNQFFAYQALLPETITTYVKWGLFLIISNILLYWAYTALEKTIIGHKPADKDNEDKN